MLYNILERNFPLFLTGNSPATYPSAIEKKTVFFHFNPLFGRLLECIVNFSNYRVSG